MNKKRLSDFFVNETAQTKKKRIFYEDEKNIEISEKKPITREYNIVNLISSLKDDINLKFNKIENSLIKQNEKINNIENKINNLEEFMKEHHESVKNEFLYLEELLPSCDNKDKNKSFFDLVIS